MILTAELRFNGGYQVRRIATDFYYSLTSDDDGLQQFSGRIIGVPSFSTKVGCIIWGNRTSSSIGTLRVINTDDGITEWLSLRYRDCECILKLLEPGDSYDYAKTVARCIIDNVEMDEMVLVVSLRGKDTLLDKPLQPLTYTAAQASEATSIEGQSIPICIGTVFQIEPVLVDVNSLTYDVGDSHYKSIDEVLSGGSVANPPTESPDDWAYTETGFRMLNTPSARVTVNMVGGRRPFLVKASNLMLDADWTGSVPTGWTATLGGGTITNVSGIGGRFLNTGSADDPSISYPVDQGSWYFVIGELVNVDAGGIAVQFGSERTEYRREGRFCALGLVESGADVTVTALGDSDVTIGYLHIYQMVNGSNSLEFSYIMDDICVRAGLRTTGSVPQRDVLVSGIGGAYSAGFYSRDAITARDALQSVIDSVSGWMFTNCDGVIVFGKYALPTSTASVITASSLNLLTYPVYKPDLAPGLSTRCEGGKNWSPYSDGELAGITYPNRPPFMAEYRFVRTGEFADLLAREYTHALSAEPIKTMIADADDVQLETNRITSITTDKRGFWELNMVLESAADITTVIPNAGILLSGAFFGEDNGRVAKIVGVEGEYNNPIIKIIAWGAIDV